MRKVHFTFFAYICMILLLLSLLLIPLISGKDKDAVQMIIGLFAIWMVFGVYKGSWLLPPKPKTATKPTFQGVEYNRTPIPLWITVCDFFNPLKMEFRTVGSIFIVGSLWIAMRYISPGYSVYFWIMLVLAAIAKGFLLCQYLRLAYAKNVLGRTIMKQMGDIGVADYDVTRDMIMADNTDASTVIGPIRFHVNVFGTYDDYNNAFSKFSRGQRYILAINWYLSEVYGDGHDVFFTGHAGIVYMDAIKGLKAMGADKYADILKIATEKFNGISKPLYDMEQRAAIIEDLNIDFEDDDNALYELDEYGEDIERKQMDYIRSHAKDFLYVSSK